MELRCHRPLVLTSVVAVAALSLLAAGCGGGGSPEVAGITSSTAPSGAGSPAITSQSHGLLLAGRCLRQHGIPNLPDPTIASSGPAKGQAILDKQFLRAVPSSVLDNAMLACRAALAQAGIVGGPSAGTRTPQEIQDGLAFARCVRNHGIPNFPDPNRQGDFNLAGTGINQHALSPAELAAVRTCLSTAHGAVHIPPQGTATSNTGR